MNNTSKKIKKYVLITCGIIILAAVGMIGYGVYSFSQLPEMFRLNRKCQEQGYYMGDFEFKLLGTVRWLDTGHYIKAVKELNKYHEQLKTKQGLIKVPKFQNTEEELEFYLSLQNPKTGAFMDGSFPLCEYAGPTSNVLIMLDELAKKTGRPLKLKYPLRFLDQVNTPKKMKSFLDSLSTVGWLGTKFPQTPYEGTRCMLSLFYENDIIERNHLYDMPEETKTAMVKWFYENQDPKTGFWGPRNKNGDLAKKDLSNSASIAKIFYINKNQDIFNKYYPRYNDKLAKSFLNTIKPPPNDTEPELWHVWNLDTSKSLKAITRYLWNDLPEKSRQKVKTVIEKYISLKFQKFYVGNEGAFSYYPDSKHATLDGSSFIVDLRDFGYCSAKNQVKLWGGTKKTIKQKNEYNTSSFTKADLHMDINEVNSIRFYVQKPKTENCIDNVLGVFYPQKTGIPDAMELIPEMQNWLNNTQQNMGNWVSKGSVQKILKNTGIKTYPCIKEKLPVKELNDILQKNRKLIIIGFDVLQNPIVENVYNLSKENNIPVDICCGAQYDVGFYVAAHLKLNDVAICVYDKDYISAMKKAHKELGIDDIRIEKESPYLSKELTKYWKVHRLVRVPVYFDNFKDTETAYDLLLGKVKINDSNRHVWNLLQNNMLKLYPYLDKFSGEEKLVAEKLVDLIEYEYYHFYKKYFNLNKVAFSKRASTFKSAWQKEYEPALKVLNTNSHSLKKVEIILSPALQVHGKSFRVIDGVGRVATLLPKNNEELQRGLVNAYHEMCHGFSDKIVYKEMNIDRNKMSFKGSEQGSDIHSLIENAANQTMYLGLKYGNPQLLNYFFNKTSYGDLSWMLKYHTFKNSFKLAGRNLSENEIDKLIEKMKVDPVGASKYIYGKGLLINPDVYNVLLGYVEEN